MFFCCTIMNICTLAMAMQVSCVLPDSGLVLKERLCLLCFASFKVISKYSHMSAPLKMVICGLT